ncbi:MAG: mannose-6-phosphate isomerase [Patescibacteria group bacterium]|nr:cupin [Candidatus Saccharibacteria bacterium]MDQ5963503.1 mannose-6-phosphate isomerase [Patescibacteria group bacterium]
MQDQPPRYDPKDFDTSAYVKRVEKPWGWELHWVHENAPYMGKILHINAGKRLSLQIHDEKQDSWFLIRGKAAAIWEDNCGELVETILEAGKGYSTKVGQKHRLVGITDADVVEVSTPELGTTWRLEDDFSRPHETPKQRKIERGE